MSFNLNLKLSHKGLLLVSVPLFFELVFIVTLYVLLMQADGQARLLENKRAISAHTSLIAKHVYDAGNFLMSYINKRDPTYAHRYEHVAHLVPNEIRELKKLTRQNPAESSVVDRIEAASKVFFKALRPIKRAADRGDRLRAYMMGARFQGTDNELADLGNEVEILIDMQQAKKVTPESEASSRQFVIIWLVIGVGLNVLVAVALAIYFGKSTAVRLNVLMDNLRRLPRKEPLNPLLGGNDEIAELDQVFHSMVASLNEAERKEREIEKLKQEFVAMISHDLRTPLTAIQGTLALFSNGVFGEIPDKGKQRLVGAEMSTRRLIKLVNELLDLERLEAGKMVLQKEEVSADSILERSVESVRGFAEEQGVSLESNPCDAVVSADGDRIVQVLVNLLSNAVKFSPSGSTVTLFATQTDSHLEMRITDQGRGIPVDQRSAIFERFRQVELSDSKKKGGTGLGLAICKAIVTQHGGQIGVDSEQGRGSTFWFKIPVSGHSSELDDSKHVLNEIS